MRNLLSAEFSRLRKSRIFWAELAWVVIGNVFMLVSSYRTYLGYGAAEDPMLESFLFEVMPMFGILAAVFSGLFLGTEYSDGTLRNKLVVGSSRIRIYLTNVIVAVAAGFALNLAGLLTCFAVGVPMFGWPVFPAEQVAVCILLAFLLVAAFFALSTMVVMLIASKANAAVCGIVLSIALIFAGSYLDNVLSAPEYYREGPVMMFEDGKPVLKDPSEELVENPHYIGGTQRVIYEYLRDLLPTGQAIRLSHVADEGEESMNVVRMALLSLLFAAAVTGAGAAAFRRKDLK